MTLKAENESLRKTLERVKNLNRHTLSRAWGLEPIRFITTVDIDAALSDSTKGVTNP